MSSGVSSSPYNSIRAPTLMTSFSLNCHLKGPISKHKLAMQHEVPVKKERQEAEEDSFCSTPEALTPAPTENPAAREDSTGARSHPETKVSCSPQSALESASSEVQIHSVHPPSSWGLGSGQEHKAPR